MKSFGEWQVVEFSLEATVSKIVETLHIVGRTESRKRDEVANQV